MITSGLFYYQHNYCLFLLKLNSPFCFQKILTHTVLFKKNKKPKKGSRSTKTYIENTKSTLSKIQRLLKSLVVLPPDLAVYQFLYSERLL